MRGEKHGSVTRQSVGQTGNAEGCCLQRLRKRWMKLFSQRLSKQLAWQKLSMKRRLLANRGARNRRICWRPCSAFLTARYDFRYNLLTEQTEYRGKEMPDEEYGIVAQRDLNTFCLEARSGGINAAGIRM